jgi:PTS system mannose-specific IIC component/fructoselysine and glucoselysine-specific PTS system IIC component
MSIIQAILLGLLGGLGIWDSRAFGICMLDRPLVLGPLVGLILGNLPLGIVIGASLELVMMGVVGIGSATPPDTVSGSILATAFAIVSGLEVGAAVALALPIATLGQLVGILDRTANAYFVNKADKAAERGDYKGVDRALYGGLALFFISYFLLVFIGSLLGSAVIGAFVDKLPQFVINGFSVASGMLPALGIAILMQLLFDKKNAAFFFVGWVLTALIGVNTVGTAVLGTTIAVLIYQYTLSAREKAAAAQPVYVSTGDSGAFDDLDGEL